MAARATRGSPWLTPRARACHTEAHGELHGVLHEGSCTLSAWDTAALVLVTAFCGWALCAISRGEVGRCTNPCSKHLIASC